MEQPIESLRALFAEALEILDAEERARFLARSCGTDLALRKEIEELLIADAKAAPAFLPGPAPRTDAQRVPDAGAHGLEEKLSLNSAAPLSEDKVERVGRYRLLEQIGEGGCGVIYLAQQDEPVRRQVAIKVIKLGMDTKQVVARFEGERQALALMDHPNIARALDAGATETGRPYFVMELVRGTKITDYSEHHGLSTRERLELFIQVCQAVQHAHQKGVIHRDLKPSNILVTVQDGVAVPKVIDFGIAKATEGRLTDNTIFTAAEQFLGTPAYMSPEQAATSTLDIDTRSDIYSLGVLLYELLTGTTPFDTQALLAVGLDELRRTIREKEPLRPSTRLSQIQGERTRRAGLADPSKSPAPRSRIDRDLDCIVLRCLQKDRNRRYETANSLASDLKRYLKNEPVIARPPSRLYEFQKTVRRHKTGFTAVAAMMVLLAAAALVSTSEALRARRAEWEQNRLAMAARRESYARAMLLGYESLEARDYGLVRELLAQTRASAVEEEQTRTGRRLTAWEWRHLSYETRDEAASVLAERTYGVESMAISPNGEWLAAGDAAGQVAVWALLAKAPPRQWQVGAEVEYLTFSPDGGRLAVASIDGTVRTLANPSGTLISEFHEPSRILDLRFSSDGQRLASCSEETFSVVNIQTKIREQSAHQDAAWAAAISPDFQLIARAVRPEGLLFCRNGTNLLTELVGTRLNSRAHRISPDGRWLATVRADYSIEIWSLDRLKPERTLRNHIKAPNVVAWSLDSRLLASAGEDQIICVWEVETGRLLRSLQGHEDRVDGLAFSPDNHFLFSGGWDKKLRVWTPLEPGASRAPVPLLPATGNARLGPGGRFLCTRSPGPVIRVFETSPELTFYDWTHDVGCAAISCDGRSFAAASARGNLCELWRRDTNGFVLESSQVGLENARGTAFSRDGQRLAFSADGSFGVWDVKPWRSLARWQEAEWKEFGMVFDPPGKRIFIACYNKGLLVGNVETHELTRFPKKHLDAISHVDISPDNRFVATSSFDGAVLLWSFAPGEKPNVVGPPLVKQRTGAWSVAFSPDGQRLAVGFADGQIQLWDIPHRMLVGSLKGHRRAVWELAFNPADDSLVSVSPDELRVWHVSPAAELSDR
jgi:WD40 repeat protein/serine/threonine protein kinase